MPPSPPDDLQFDHVADAADPAAAAAPSPATAAVVCASCGTPLTTEYYDVNGTPVCAACRAGLERHAADVRRPGVFARAVLFGLGAAVAGAAIYYAVIAITDFEIGLVAILIGYMVGYAVRKATAGRGGRRFQVLGAGLTYLAVGLAYFALAIKQDIGKTAASPAPAADSAAAAAAPGAPAGAPAIAEAPPPPPVHPREAVGVADDPARPPVADPEKVPAPTETGSPVGMAGAVAGLLFLIVALPVMAVMGTMPSGLISALIIGIGMHQAWQMTGAPRLEIHGPFRVGGVPDESPAPALPAAPALPPAQQAPDAPAP